MLLRGLMKVIKLNLSNLYSFKDFEVDFRVPRKVENPYRNEKIEVSRINPKDINVIIGNNASGKTALSKSLLLTCRILRGYSISSSELESLSKTENTQIKVIFIITKEKTDHCYEYKIVMNSQKILHEVLSYQKLGKNESYKEVNFKVIQDYENKSEKPDVQSVIMNSLFDDHKICNEFGYSFQHSNFGDNNTLVLEDIVIPNEVMENFLKTIDNSTLKVKNIESDGEVLKLDFMITFKNGEHIIISGNDLNNISHRLSYGTIEAIQFIYKIFQINSDRYDIVFIDECLTHIHTELEKELLSICIEVLPKSSQLFFTTHNNDILNMNLPISCFTILSENSDGNTQVSNPEKVRNQKNDRNNLLKLIEKDLFNTSKDFGELYNILSSDL